uniref:F-box domain-containing protein n=1 Tax=Ditylenchus dipsaci TaxID=166011 RepID=A0A915E244_9BILA
MVSLPAARKSKAENLPKEIWMNVCGFLNYHQANKLICTSKVVSEIITHRINSQTKQLFYDYISLEIERLELQAAYEANNAQKRALIRHISRSTNEYKAALDHLQSRPQFTYQQKRALFTQYRENIDNNHDKWVGFHDMELMIRQRQDVIQKDKGKLDKAVDWTLTCKNC